mgnify:CR=1 FL=1
MQLEGNCKFRHRYTQSIDNRQTLNQTLPIYSLCRYTKGSVLDVMWFKCYGMKDINRKYSIFAITLFHYLTSNNYSK